MISSAQSLSLAWLFVTPWTAAGQASLSITNSWSLLKLMSIESLMPSNHLILCCPLLLLPSIFPSIRVFSNESVHIRWPNIGVSASGSVLPMNIQDWFLLGWTCWISLLSKGLSRVFSNTTVQKHHFFSACEVKCNHSVMSDSLQPHGLYSPWNSPGQNTGVGSLSLLQGIFQTQGSNPGLLHCRQILPCWASREAPLRGAGVIYENSQCSWACDINVALG